LQAISMQTIWFGVKRLERFLPIRLYNGMRRIAGRTRPSRQEMVKIESLGEIVGLEKAEVVSALDSPLGTTGIDSKQRLTLFISIVAVFVIAIISVLLVWYVEDPDSFPIPRYLPESLYGTISPRDFNIVATTIV
jgi:hypothetical protein